MHFLNISSFDIVNNSHAEIYLNLWYFHARDNVKEVMIYGMLEEFVEIS